MAGNYQAEIPQAVNVLENKTERTLSIPFTFQDETSIRLDFISDIIPSVNIQNSNKVSLKQNDYTLKCPKNQTGQYILRD